MKSLNFQTLLAELAVGANFFQIPHIQFLRKCVAIRTQLSLMGYPNARVQIRNIPVGSENYYLCYPDFCSAFAYEAQKNEAGEIVEFISHTTLRTEQEVIEYEAIKEEDQLYSLKNQNVYPTVEPSPIEFYVYEDERLSFQASESYIVKVIATINAINEIENDSAQIFVTVTQIKEWLERHHHLYWSMQMDFNALAFRPFQNLYSGLQYIADDFKHIEKAQQAVDEYKPFDEAWLYKYNRLYFTALMGWESGYEVFHEEPFIIKQEFGNLHLIGKEFRGLHEFPKLFVMEYDRGRDIPEVD